MNTLSQESNCIITTERGKEKRIFKGANCAVLNHLLPEEHINTASQANPKQIQETPAKLCDEGQIHVCLLSLAVWFPHPLPHLRFVATDLVAVAYLPGDRCLPYVIKAGKVVTVTFPIPTTQIKLTFNEFYSKGLASGCMFLQGYSWQDHI